MTSQPDMTLPQSLEARTLSRSGVTIGVHWLDDGFHATVPCTMPGCYQPANLMVYELAAGGKVWRRCREHAPEGYLHALRSLTTMLGNMREDCL